MAKSAIQRVDDSLTAGKNMGDAAVRKLFICLERNLNADPVSKQFLGDKISLGYYTGASDAKTAQRKLVRAALLLRLTVGGMTFNTPAFKLEKTRLLALGDDALKAELRLMQQAGPAESPAQILTIGFNNDAGSKDGIVHHFSIAGTSATRLHLAHIATREFVVYTTVAYVGGVSAPLTLYGGARNFPSRTHAPWFPHAAKFGEMVSPPNPTLKGPFPNGLVATGSDTHSFGPLGASTAADVGILAAPLVACELRAEQVYQYNDTCDPDTWTRDDPLNKDVIAAVHANDQYWKDFPTDGKWLIRRRLFVGLGGVWQMETVKTGAQNSNQAITFSRTSAIAD